MPRQSFVTGYSEHESEQELKKTRLIVLGGAALTQGFAMIGFETWPDADENQLETLLMELLKNKQKALVLLEPYLARCDCKTLIKIRNEGDRIVIAEIPPLQLPDDYHPEIESLISSVLGPNALEDI